MASTEFEAWFKSLPAAKPNPAFDAWMAKVEAAIEKATGLSSSDLDDFMYDDAWQDGATPAQAAKAAIKNAGG